MKTEHRILLYMRFFPKKKHPTPEAESLARALESHGLRVRRELWDRHKHIDLAIPAAKIDIEVDGPQHLTNYKQILSDLERSHYSDDDGYATMHIHNEEILLDLERIASAIAKAARIRIDQRKSLKLR